MLCQLQTAMSISYNGIHCTTNAFYVFAQLAGAVEYTNYTSAEG